MNTNIYPVVKILHGQCDEISTFDTEEAALEYAEQTVLNEDYDIVSIFRVILNNPNVQLTIKEFRKGTCS
ncbi:hypothetical protein Desca_2442 [Desulfotomaculum nigrificans CO-1-SRB]|uniref:Uncharacterized protein n=1 Tax=Desulfotomaculum nigrificans (strain DSM 14880 / VKM B-2319 / CO-1-SRB) TaxID=868595 RepID=F6B493_DESCC|nr:hypothetical protein [Desulfotomaculum nigrificans]AEF95270.1 hypothetical protein Desca_2442 [Desulfotomaculum nigrificans CO-1-SRB]